MFGVGKSLYDCDRLVALKLLSELQREAGGQGQLTPRVRQMVSVVIEEGAVARQRERSGGKDAARQYAAEVVIKAEQALKASQRQAQQPNQQRRGGLER